MFAILLSALQALHLQALHPHCQDPLTQCDQPPTPSAVAQGLEDQLGPWDHGGGLEGPADPRPRWPRAPSCPLARAPALSPGVPPGPVGIHSRRLGSRLRSSGPRGGGRAPSLLPSTPPSLQRNGETLGQTSTTGVSVVLLNFLWRCSQKGSESLARLPGVPVESGGTTRKSCYVVVPPAPELGPGGLVNAHHPRAKATSTFGGLPGGSDPYRSLWALDSRKRLITFASPGATQQCRRPGA